MYRFDVFVLCGFVIGVCVVLSWTRPVRAQSRPDREAPTYREPAPRRGGGGTAPTRERNRPAQAPGTGLPPAAEPAPPPSFGGSSRHAGRTGAAANSDLSTPRTPSQAPIGGTEWLAVAGAAYALNRLRKKRGADEAEEG